MITYGYQGCGKQYLLVGQKEWCSDPDVCLDCREIMKIVPTRQTVVIMVGADRCGKSEIAKELSMITGIPVFKASSEHKAFLGDQKSFINDLLYADPRACDLIKQTGLSVIMDRAYPCEKVYAEFFGRKTDIEALRFVDEWFADIGAKVVICTRKSFVGIKDDLDPRLDEVALQKISVLYQEFAKWTKCKTYTLYVDDEDLHREVNEVLQFMKYNEEE